MFRKGKHDKAFRMTGKTALVIALSTVLLLTAVAGTVAFIFTQTPPVSNTFTPAQVTCRVQESFSGGIKKDVCVQNTGNIPAYIRAYITVNWVSAEGYVHATSPVEATDYSMLWIADGWVCGTDGFWYYTQPVAPGAPTGVLLGQAQALSDGPVGCRLDVQIHASALQAEPLSVVEQVWGVTLQPH